MQPRLLPGPSGMRRPLRERQRSGWDETPATTIPTAAYTPGVTPVGVVEVTIGIPALLPFLKAVCESKKSWHARHTGIKIVQQIAILIGCAVVAPLKVSSGNGYHRARTE